MKAILYILAAFILLPLHAQTSLSRSDIAHREGDQYSYRSSDPMDYVTSLDPEPAGAGISWDLSQINTSLLDGVTSEYVDPSDTPFAEEAEEATLAIKNQGGIDGPYQFVRISDSGMDYLYTAWYEEGNTSFSTHTPAVEALRFPLQYGDSWSQDYVVELWTMGSLFMLDSCSTQIEVDAYGTVSTPAGTFNDALRMKRSTSSTAYMYFEGNWVYTTDLSSTDYTWFIGGVHSAIITVSKFEGDPGYSVIYMTEVEQATAVKERRNQSLRLYPNPACNFLTVENPGGSLGDYSLYDSSGRCLIRGSGNAAGAVHIQLEQLEAGSYILKIQSGKEVIREMIQVR